MTEPGQFTAQQAADPSTPGEVLAAIAAERPDLRPALASNPAAYPGLLEWLGGLGDPAVDEALRARVAPEPPTEPAPQAPQEQAGAGEPEPPTAPHGTPAGAAYTPPAAAAGYPAGTSEPPVVGTSAPPPGGWAPPPAGYPQPGGEQQPAGAPVPGYGPPPGAGSAPPPGGPYGTPPGGPAQPRKSRAWIWILAAVLVLLVVGGGIYLVVRAVSNAADTIDEIVTTEDATSYGDDATLDALWDACAAGDMQSCDDLFVESPVGSDYEEFGDTCGGRTDGGTWCVDDAATSGEGSATAGAPFAYGDDTALDALWDACAAGDMAACDDLYRESPVGSEYEVYGDSCGGRTEGGTWCDQ